MPAKTKNRLEPVETEIPTRRKRVVPWGSLIFGLLFLIAAGLAGYFYYQTKQGANLTQEEEKNDLTETLGEFLDLPTDETPTLATVTDVEKLWDQPFFAKAENGDKVLIYSKSGRAILYRPSTGKVIEMTTASVENTTAEANVNPATMAQEQAEVQEIAARVDLEVTLLNGSTKNGITAEAEEKITESLENYTIQNRANATKNDYQGILVVSSSGEHADRAQELATLLGGRVGSLPEGETASSDIVIIIGN